MEAKDEHDDSESPRQESYRKRVNQLDKQTRLQCIDGALPLFI
jgi:hypothetical protein